MSDRWTNRLSEYLDDDLSASERRSVEAHLQECADCRTTLAELHGVVERAGSLPARPPVSDLWDGIETRIGATAPPASRRSAWRISFTLPQFAAAALALMVLSGGAVWIAQHGGRATSLQTVGATANASGGERRVPVTFSDANYDEAVADLEQALQSGRGSLDPQTIDIIENNLQAIDRAIDQSRHALEQDPANIYLNNHLAEAKQQKLTLLRQATAIASTKGS
ncbi:MAG TPA: zf-HC2 domain-containing protein [Vicinamibacterales bacterium]|nr:zf-HC2 domain-containing protein [Vicinamibacterales bacterium]